MTTSIQSSSTDLLDILRPVFPTIHSFHILDTVVQANAVGYKVQLSYHDDQKLTTTTTTRSLGATHSHGRPAMVFVKHVDAAVYVTTKKDWKDLQRTLLYARNEVRFYRSILPQIMSTFSSAPHCYHASYQLDGWIEEETILVSSATPATTNNSIGGVVILDWISETTHFQDSPLSLQQCKRCLSAVAKMHAASWQNVPLLQQAAKELSKASFHLTTRNPNELAGMEEAWTHFSAAFAPELSRLGLGPVSNLGVRVARLAHYISEQVSPNPEESYATIIHGDYKAMNVFLPKEDNGTTLIVDYASTGVGLGMSDVAMHIHHAVRPEHLANGGEDELVQYYLDALRETGTIYPDEVALRHYRFGVVDYFRFFLGRFWKTATHESMRKMKDSKNTNLINRDVDAAIAFIVRAKHYLEAIEKEYEDRHHS